VAESFVLCDIRVKHTFVPFVRTILVLNIRMNYLCSCLHCLIYSHNPHLPSNVPKKEQIIIDPIINLHNVVALLFLGGSFSFFTI